MIMNRLFAMTLTAGMVFGSLSIAAPEEAEAKRCWRNPGGRMVCDNGKHRGMRWSRDGRYFYDDRRRAWVDYRTNRIIKGGLVGAGVGAGAGYLLDKPVGKSAVVGGLVGAGLGAVTD